MANFKDYTRLRDIAQKRQKRLSAAGLAAPIHIPTVKEIKAGMVDADTAMRTLKNYLSDASTVTAARQTGTVASFQKFPELPKQLKFTAEELRERRRQQARRSRQRARIRKESTPEQFKKYASYLKALDTVNKTWSKAGFKIGIDLTSMTPSQAQAFVEYMDFRFSQGDFTQHYVIDEFIQGFSKLMKSGYKGKDIVGDFNKFLEDRKGLEARASNMEGLSSAESMRLWDQFINRG